MNNQVIPLGAQETITNGSLTKKALILWAETNTTITGLVFCNQAEPAHANAISAFTLAAGRYLVHVQSMSFTGTITVCYRGD